MSAAAWGRRTRAFAWSVLAGMAWFWLSKAVAARSVVACGFQGTGQESLF